MAATRRLDELFHVAERFRRSVNVAMDYPGAAGLEGYVVTTLSAAVLSRIAAGLLPASRNRSWSITGPYGAGKSACMLLLAQMLGHPSRRAVRAAVQQNQPELYGQVKAIPGWEHGGFVIVPLVCSRWPLAHTLLSGLLDTVSPLATTDANLIEQVTVLRRLYDRAQQEEPVPSAEIAATVQATAALLQAHDASILGMIVVLDELGKALEYAALNPDRGDIELLQILAEMASRSNRPAIGLLTVLHQAFEHYAASLSPTQQREWAKVQGRFEDVGFFQSQAEFLNLVSRSIEAQDDSAGLHDVIAAEARRAGELELLPRDLAAEDALQIITRCAPLHPTTALALGPLFRSRLAQNERSAFAFLSSGEPYGFQDYLHAETWRNNGDRPFYRLDRLHDYTLAALGSGLYAQAQGKRWAEIGDALERLPKDAPALDTALVKAIGLLGLLGDQRYLRASRDILTYALADGHITPQDVQASLARLETSKITIYQRFKDAYGLWQGSDVDLDARFELGAGQLDRSVSLAQRLQEGGYLQPYVAKRHLHETGTLRFLAPRVSDLEALDPAGEDDLLGADGLVVFVLPPQGMPLAEVRARVSRCSAALSAPRRAQTVYAVPRHLQGIRESLEEVLAWQWVTEHTPELEGDAVARRELSARYFAARARLERAVSHGFALASGYATCAWIWQGREHTFASARALAGFISDVCDGIYSGAPLVRNELINRRSLSSAAAAARRALIERMLAHPDCVNLGLQGYPPEMSIYLSLLKAGGLHRETPQGWSFGPPDAANDPCRLGPMWAAIQAFLSATEAGRRPVPELFDLLRRPPFGVRDGVLPIYLAAYVIQNHSEVALYEEGTFVPQPGIAEFERLVRAPQRFALQQYRLTDARARLLAGYIRIFNPRPEPGQVTLLNAVRALMGFAARLPRYTQLTDDLSADALAVRQALTSAREPQPLLFEALPAALGCEPGDAGGERLDAYFTRLRRALLELQRAYDRLLAAIEGELLAALHLPADLPAARREMAQRADILGEWIADLNVRAFALRLGDTRLARREWLESVASVVAGKPPSSWNEGDRRKYRATLPQLAAQLRRVEEVALSHGQRPAAGRIVRLGITSDVGREQREILHVSPDQEAQVQGAADALSEALGTLELDDQVRLAALAELARRLMNATDAGED